LFTAVRNDYGYYVNKLFNRRLAADRAVDSEFRVVLSLLAAQG
jgi:hypothetical protein